MAANSARPYRDWGWRKKSCGSTHCKNGILASVFSDSFQVLHLSELWCLGVLD